MLFALAMPTTRPLLPVRSSRLMSSPCHHARALHDGEPRQQAVRVVVAADRKQFVAPSVAHVAAGERLEPDLSHDRPDQVPIEVRPEWLSPPAFGLTDPNVDI